MKVLTLLSMVALSWCCQSVGALSISVVDATDITFRKDGVERVTSTADLQPQSRASKSYTFKPVLNVPQGTSYVIVTDHNDPACLESLNKLARYHSAKIIQLADFSNLPKLPGARASLVERLRKANPAYVALAPRIENFSENSLLAVWQVLLTLGNGTLNVYPGYLVGRNCQELDALVDRSIHESKLAINALNPVVIAQATDQKSGGMRAVQKAKVMEDLFHELGVNCAGLVVRSNTAPPPVQFPTIGTLGTLHAPANGFVQQVPAKAEQALKDSHLILLFGHGSPGMTCSLAVKAFRDVSMSNDVVLCGSCFSCTPLVSDIMQSSNGKRPESLAYRTLANGAQVFYGHMHENSGFPQLFLAFESLMKGETVGQSYQRVLNCVFADTKVPQSSFVMSSRELSDPHAIDRRNDLLFVMVGDPAARPITTSAE